MATYRLIGGTFVHGYNENGEQRIWRARNLPRVEPGGPVANGGPVDPLWKEGDDIIKTNKLFRVVNRHKVTMLTLDQLHPNKFIVETTEDCKPEEDAFLTGYRRHSNHVPNSDGALFIPAAQAARQQPKSVVVRTEELPKAAQEPKPQQQGQRKPDQVGAGR